MLFALACLFMFTMFLLGVTGLSLFFMGFSDEKPLASIFIGFFLAALATFGLACGYQWPIWS